MKKLLSTLLIIFIAASGLRSQSVSDSTHLQQDSSRPVVHKKAVAPKPVRRDTLVRAGVIDTPMQVPAQNVVASDWISELKNALAQHPYFNFTGKAVARPEIIRDEKDDDAMFYLLLGLFFYFALVKTLFSKYVNNLVAIFLRITLKQQQLREQLLQAPLPSLLLNLLFFVNAGLYTSLLLQYFQIKVVNNFWLQSAYCMLLLATIYTGKLIVLKSLGWVFNIRKATDTYIFIVFLVNKMLGIFLLPFLVLIVFEPTQAKQVFVTLSLIIIIMLVCYRFLFSFRPVQNEIKWSLLQFFIYLCAFEIAPLVLIYKVLLTIVEKSH